jgi:hypothetical protein
LVCIVSGMTWKAFVQRWRPVVLTRLGIPNRTVYDWRSGTKEPVGWQREAAEFWIESKAGIPQDEAKQSVRKAEK